MKTLIGIAVVVAVFAVAWAAVVDAAVEKTYEDMLTPAYYGSADEDPIRAEVDRFISVCREVIFHHPLEDTAGKRPEFQVPRWGSFGAGKPPGRSMQHHPAADFKINGGETEVALYAAHDGRINTFRDAPKYRHYLAITRNVVSEDRDLLGKIVTLYGHIDLDLDEAAGLSLNGKLVRKGDLVSRHLYSGTKGGPHLHFEIRYYRSGDTGDETFYGSLFPGSENPDLNVKSKGPWDFGYWNPSIGYGFANPRNHGIYFDKIRNP